MFIAGENKQPFLSLCVCVCIANHFGSSRCMNDDDDVDDDNKKDMRMCGMGNLCGRLVLLTTF